MGRLKSVLHTALGRMARNIPGDILGRTALHRSNEPAAVVDFVCNICGAENHLIPLEHVQNREFQSCTGCRSSLRMRSVIHALSIHLFGEALTLPSFPEDKGVSGIGMSDWEGYAIGLKEKFSYTNTFYHTEPVLDITRIPEHLVGNFDFLISSDVFEHIPVFALGAAFFNARRLLKPSGVFIFTVPFTSFGQTVEHFPRLHDFKIIETHGKRFLYNRTESNDEEIFDNLIFHGGDGMTLEMRIFSESDLRTRLTNAGFSRIEICSHHYAKFGILWPMTWAVPIVATVDR